MKKKFTRHFFVSENAIIGYIFIFKILFHLLHPEYGYLRDELFYIAISDQFSFENLDVLPLTPLVLKLFTTILGYSIKSLHFASSFIGAIYLLVACLITRELGGKKYAILLTGIFVMFSGVLIFGALYTYDSLDFLIWILSIYLLVRIIKENKPKLWVLLGVVLGLGLFNKLTILFLGLAIFVSLWLVPQRIYFKSRWIWLAGIIALLFSLPFVIWQSLQNWYFISVAANYSGGLAYIASFPEYVWSQLLPNNIFLFPVWITGLGLLLFSSKWKQYRLFGIMYVFLFFTLFFVGAKFYFLIPMYSILIVVGSIRIEAYFENRDSHQLKLKIARVILPIGYVLLSLPLMPMLVPILPVEQLVKYTVVLGVDAGVRTENKQLNQLPQHIADRFGWEEMVDQIAAVYDSVQADNTEEVGLLTENWGQAGALHLLGKKYNLPEPVSLHGWYYYQTLLRSDIMNNYISIGLPQDGLQTIFKEVIPCGTYTHRYCMPYENNKPIYLCKKPKVDLKQYWLVDRNINPRFQDILRNQTVQSAIDYFYQTRQNNPSIVMFTERQINSLGYDYLFKGQIEDAIILFQLNVDVFPESSNVYDSLGEGYMENGEYDLSIVNYEKSLELNPNNSNAVEMLKKIEKLMKSR
jgi:tetratricopeptide (TPR) repeat protein